MLMFLVILMVALHVILLVNYYTMELFLLSSIAITMTIFLLFCLTYDGLIGFALLTLATYDLHLRINKINKNIIHFETWNIKDEEVYSKVAKFIVEHNQLCSKVKKFSEFWQNIYLALILTITPSNLILLFLIVFEQMDAIIRTISVTLLIDSYLVLLVLQYFFASLSHKMHKQCKLLARSQWLFNKSDSGLRFKIKVQTYIERLSSDRRIGFSIGSLTVITYPLFAAVSQTIIDHINS